MAIRTVHPQVVGEEVGPITILIAALLLDHKDLTSRAKDVV